MREYQWIYQEALRLQLETIVQNYNATNASLGKISEISDRILGGASAKLHVAVLVNSHLATRVASSRKMS
jgi:hypothetical protein